MAAPTHAQLVMRASSWLRGKLRYPVVFCEPSTFTDEMPDVIGFKRGSSVVIECKTSRADAYAEKRKKWRQWSLGMGNFCYFLMPFDLAQSLGDWVCCSWPSHGLLGAKGRSVVELKAPQHRVLCEYAAREERHILEKSFQRVLSGRRFIKETGSFEAWGEHQRSRRVAEYSELLEKLRALRQENIWDPAGDRPLLAKLEDLYSTMPEEDRQLVSAQSYRVWPDEPAGA